MLEDGSNVKTLFAEFVFQVLPDAQINITPGITALITGPASVCQPCNYDQTALVYNFGKNSLEYKKRWLLTKGHPIVGKSYTFSVISFNPFRDSIIIGSETADFNTDVPELFNKAFFSPALLAGPIATRDAILADVLALGTQLNEIIDALKNLKECEDICGIVQTAKTNIEAHFQTKYSYKAQNPDLIAYLLVILEDVQPLYKDQVVSILNKYRSFYSIKNYFNYNIPQVQNVDAYIFTLSVIPKVGLKSNTVVDKQPIYVPTLGGFKIDFSTGLFITSLYDHRFNLRPDSSVIRNSYGGDSIVFNRRNQIVRQTNDENLDFGVSALAHFYPRLTPSVNFALSLGAGLSIDKDPSIRYLAGGSLLLGRKGRLAITYGCAAGFVDRLDDSYQNLQFTSISDKKAITKKSFRTKGFWSVTFNIPLFKPKVKEAAPPVEEKTEEKEETKTEEKKDK